MWQIIIAIFDFAGRVKASRAYAGDAGVTGGQKARINDIPPLFRLTGPLDTAIVAKRKWAE
jgi:hypothetical protein